MNVRTRGGEGGKEKERRSEDDEERTEKQEKGQDKQQSIRSNFGCSDCESARPSAPRSRLFRPLPSPSPRAPAMAPRHSWSSLSRTGAGLGARPKDRFERDPSSQAAAAAPQAQDAWSSSTPAYQAAWNSSPPGASSASYQDSWGGPPPWRTTAPPRNSKRAILSDAQMMEEWRKAIFEMFSLYCLFTDHEGWSHRVSELRYFVDKNGWNEDALKGVEQLLTDMYEDCGVNNARNKIEVEEWLSAIRSTREGMPLLPPPLAQESARVVLLGQDTIMTSSNRSKNNFASRALEHHGWHVDGPEDYQSIEPPQTAEAVKAWLQSGITRVASTTLELMNKSHVHALHECGMVECAFTKDTAKQRFYTLHRPRRGLVL